MKAAAISDVSIKLNLQQYDNDIMKTMLALTAVTCFIAQAFIWGFWTAPYVRKKKRNSAPVWAWLLLIPYVYDYLVARGIKAQSPRHRNLLMAQAAGMLMTLLLALAFLVLTLWPPTD